MEFKEQKQKTADDFDGRLPGQNRASMISDKYDPETLEIDYVAEKRLVRKLDLYIVPMVMLLYLLVCYLPPRCHLQAKTFLTFAHHVNTPAQT